LIWLDNWEEGWTTNVDHKDLINFSPFHQPLLGRRDTIYRLKGGSSCCIKYCIAVVEVLYCQNNATIPRCGVTVTHCKVLCSYKDNATLTIWPVLIFWGYHVQLMKKQLCFNHLGLNNGPES
jgi:hypothetical protein